MQQLVQNRTVLKVEQQENWDLAILVVFEFDNRADILKVPIRRANRYQERFNCFWLKEVLFRCHVLN